MTEPVAIVDVQPSKVKGKRLCAILSNGKKYNFGLDGGQTYLDHHDFNKRSNYRTRHYHNPKETKLLENLTPSNSVLSYYLLWGPHKSLDANIQYLNRLWQKLHVTG